MQFIPKINERGNRDIVLDISDLDMQNKERYLHLLTFVSYSYNVNRSKAKRTTNNNVAKIIDPQHMWDSVFYLVNKFLGRLSKQEQSAIAMTLILMHQDILDFIDADNIQDIPNLTYKLGTHLLQLDSAIDICNKLTLFVKTDVDIGDFSTAGTRPQDSAEYTFNEAEVTELTGVVLLCKLMTPIFSVLMEYLKDKIDTSLKVVHCAAIFTQLFNLHYAKLIDKLRNYVKHMIELSIKEAQIQTMSFNGYTINSLTSQIYATLISRNFINSDLMRKNGSLMRFIMVSVKRNTATKQNTSLGSPVYTRVPIAASDGDEGNIAQQELDSVTTTKIADGPQLVAVNVPYVLRKYINDATYEINITEYENCLSFYNHKPIRPHIFNKFLNGVMFGRDLGGGKSIQMLRAREYTELSTLLQIIAIGMGFIEIAHLVSAVPSSDAKMNMTTLDSFLRMNYKNSFQYKNCRARYEQSPIGGGKDWDRQVETLVDNLSTTAYVYNTPITIWLNLNQPNQNGSIFIPSEHLIQNLCGFIETIGVGSDDYDS